MSSQRGNPDARAEGEARREDLFVFLSAFVLHERVAPTRAEIAAQLGISESAVKKHLAILTADNKVEDMGGTRGLRIVE